MAKQLESISVRTANNGWIVNIHTIDEDADDMNRWDNEEEIFLEKAEMKQFIADKVDELT